MFILIVFSDKQISCKAELLTAENNGESESESESLSSLPKDLERARHAIITSRLDYCNSLHVRTGPAVHPMPAASSRCGCTPLNGQGPHFRCATLPLPASCSLQD